MWVSKDNWNISSDTDTEIYIYYDNTESDNTTYVGDVGSRTEVWDSNFKGVWHGDAVSVVDSTSNNNDYSTGNLPDLVDAYIGKGLDFEKSNSDAIAVVENGSLDITDAITCQCWVKKESIDDYVRFISKQYNGVTTGTSCYQLGLTNAAKYRWSVGGAFDLQTSTTISNGVWYYLSGTYNKVTARAYVNASQVSFTSATAAIRTSNHNMSIANQYYNSSMNQYNFDGIMDEIRVSDVVRSAAWIKVDYYAQDDNILSFSAVETYS